MNRRLFSGFLAAAALFAVHGPDPARAAAPAIPAAAAQLRTDMRKLWEDHVTWTRVYIISVGAGLGDKDAAAQRLLQNQVDIGNAIKPFYGNEAGDKLTALLKEHILGLADTLTSGIAAQFPGKLKAS
jgi:hypothetical protein